MRRVDSHAADAPVQLGFVVDADDGFVGAAERGVDVLQMQDLPIRAYPLADVANDHLPEAAVSRRVSPGR